MDRTGCVGRREFARRGLTGGIGALAAAAGVEAQPSFEPRIVSDHDILNFLLNLDYLQAEFYTVAGSGRRIADFSIAITGAGAGGETVGGAAVSLDNRVRDLAAQLGADERAHVRALRRWLGAAAVAKPAINLEALGFGFRSEADFLALARLLEDLVMTAYQGVTGVIGDQGARTIAIGLALAEAQHAGVIRSLVADRGMMVARLDGVDVPPPPSAGGRLFNVGADGLCLGRSASQALAALYRTQAPFATSGGFFPAGLNGLVRAV